MEVSFLGHSAFLIKLGSSIILTDPWLNPSPRQAQRLVPPFATQEKIRAADFILLSHEHFDHADAFDVKAIAERTNCHVVGPKETLSLANINPRLKTPVEEGDEFSLNGLDFKIVKAVHPQSVNPVGFIVRGGGQSFYFAGDTYDYYEMTDFGVDVAFLPIGGKYTMDFIGAIKAVKQMKPKFVVPMHFNTFKEIQADEREFCRRIREGTKTTPVLLSPGEKASL
ncbi:MBL fold metallo-hydrolase [Candidatus Micrarchaeota archaeon]|nr:MBL fold metallo-hydrolase [Candidatus Micrarchaeota archaeon]